MCTAMSSGQLSASALLRNASLQTPASNVAVHKDLPQSRVETMHAIQLVELATTYVAQAEAQAQWAALPQETSVHSYWLAARFRHAYWAERLSEHQRHVQRTSASERRSKWQEIAPVLQEILLSEPLTRCIAHQSNVLQQTMGVDEASTLAQSTYACHLESRNRCLHTIVFGHGMPPELASVLNRLRMHCERLTDYLLALLRPLQTEEDFGFDRLNTAAQRRKIRSGIMTPSSIRMQAALIGHWFFQETALDIDYRRPSARHHLQIANAVTGMLSPQLFDSFGIPKSHHAARYADHGLGPKPQPATGGYPGGSISSPLELIDHGTRRGPSQQWEAGRW